MNAPKDFSLPLSVIDLFAGVGGLSLGACRAGFNLRLAIEKDRHASAAHSLNFPKSRHSNSDIGKLTGAELLKLAGLQENALGGLIGGPPCQGFSLIGKRKTDDPRNLLFHKFFELVSETKPKFFLAENVPGIQQERYALIRQTALNVVEKEYHVLKPFRVTASDYGAPTTRTRVIFFGYRKDFWTTGFTESDFSPQKGTVEVTVGDALVGLPKKIKDTWLSDAQGWRTISQAAKGDFGLKLKGHRPQYVGDEVTMSRLDAECRVSGCMGMVHSSDVIRRFAETLPGKTEKISRAPRLSLDGFCPTLRAGTDGEHGSYQALRPIHPTESRMITTREAARLQGFPDWFRFAPTKWHSFRQIGNSVSPILAEALFASVLRKAKSVISEGSRQSAA